MKEYKPLKSTILITGELRCPDFSLYETFNWYKKYKNDYTITIDTILVNEKQELVLIITKKGGLNEKDLH